MPYRHGAGLLPSLSKWARTPYRSPASWGAQLPLGAASMADEQSHSVLQVDKTKSGIIVVFEDDITALYSADVLYSIIAMADILPADSEDSD